MSVKAKVEAVIYATEEPVTLNQLASLLHDEVLAELHAQEEARLALNDTVSDGQPTSAEEDTDDSETTVSPGGGSESVAAPEATVSESAGEQPATAETHSEPQKDRDKEEQRRIKAYLKQVLEELSAEYALASHGVEVRQVAGGYRIGTKPEHHDVVLGFAK